MKLIFEIEIPIEYPTYKTDPRPDRTISYMVEAVRRAIERQNIAIAQSSWPLVQAVDERLPSVRTERLSARCIGVSPSCPPSW